MKKHRKKIIIGIIGLLLLIYVGVNGYLVNYAFVRDSASLGATAPKKAELLKKDQAWLAQTKQQTWTEKSADGKLTLKARYVPAKKATIETIVFALGYR